MNQLTMPIIFMLCSVYIEALVLKIVKKKHINWLDIMFNLNSGHIVLWFFRGLEILCYALVYQYCSLNLFAHVPVIFAWIFAFIAWDFCFYWQHRLLHTFRLLYAVHIVHHQGEHFNLSLAVRNSWYSSLLSAVLNIVLAFIGVSTEIFLTVSIFHYSIQFFNHNDVTPKLGILEKIFVTPNHHRVHHINDRHYSNRNFGGSFIIWDKLFGSFAVMPAGKVSYGSPGIKTQNPLLASNYPFMQLLNISFVPTAPPKKWVFSSFLLTLGGILLFALTIAYVYKYAYGMTNITFSQYTLFGFLAAGTIFLGAMAEGRIWGLIGWTILTLSMPIVFLYLFDWPQLYWQVIIWLLTVHGVVILLYTLINGHKTTIPCAKQASS